MCRQHIVSRRLLVAATVALLALGMAGSASAKGGREQGSQLDNLRNRFSQRDTADLINHYRYADGDREFHVDPVGH